MKFLIKSAPILSLLLSSQLLNGATIHDEAISGDLSSDTNAPTILGSTTVGANTVIGAINESQTLNADVFTFNIPVNQRFIGLTVDSMTGTGDHFFALDNASTINSSDASTSLIATLINTSNVGSDILAANTGGGIFGGSGYSLPLGTGDYTVWFQEVGSTDQVDYSFTINTATIPEPSTSALALVGLSFFLRRKR